ncbi:MAG: glycosyltransferase [Candidatus Omnitrophica bacterium]|nr:glycosyltransferase [Candidatus Omnitrophota bacterium]
MYRRYSPLVSIITPVKNCSQYIEQCIRNVLAQDYPFIEHVLIDGCSTDGTLDIIKKYNAMYPDKIVFISEPDGGACEAWNKGWNLSKGEIIGWLGGDDFYEPGAISTVVEFFKSKLDAYFVFGRCNLIDDRNRKILTVGIKDFDLDTVLSSCTNVIPNPSVFYRREVIKKIGQLRTDINCCDFDYWIRAGTIYKIYRINEVLSSFRIHKNSTSGSRSSYRIYAIERYKLIRQYGGGLSLNCLIGYLISLIMDMLKYVFGSRLIYYRITYSLKNLLITIQYHIYGGKKG